MRVSFAARWIPASERNFGDFSQRKAFSEELENGAEITRGQKVLGMSFLVRAVPPLDEVAVLDLAGRREQVLLAFHNLVERLIHLVLEAKTTAHFLGVELGTCKIVHHFPVAITGPDVPEALFTNISDVEFLVLLVE